MSGRVQQTGYIGAPPTPAETADPVSAAGNWRAICREEHRGEPGHLSHYIQNHIIYAGNPDNPAETGADPWRAEGHAEHIAKAYDLSGLTRQSSVKQYF